MSKSQVRTSAARIRACELLGKHLGMFTDRMQVEGHHTHDEGKRRFEIVIVDPQEDHAGG